MVPEMYLHLFISSMLNQQWPLHMFLFSYKKSSFAESFLQVQNLIERCLQLYMNQKEVVDTLSLQAKIEPSFTELGNTLVVLYAQKSLFFLIFTLHFTSFVHGSFCKYKTISYLI